MDQFEGTTGLWNFSDPVNYTQMPNEEFLNMLNKQFPISAPHPNPPSLGASYNGAQSQAVRTSLSSLSPPSEDSSPSPTNSNHDYEDAEGTAPPKRKAADDHGEGPSSKMSTNDKKAGSSTTASTTTGARRKSTGGPKDDSKLLKRKEQNRAAQRAFRERKEKHVKDLEDRVAELLAKNNETQNENENLRDLLSRLQSENVLLKQQQQFTFSMPRSGNSQSFSPNDGHDPFGIPDTSAFASGSTSPKGINPLDWSSLNTFDPTRLNLLDEMPQSTATDGAMQMDFGFGSPNTGLASNAPYTSIASNPTFMSFASSFDHPSVSLTGDSPDMSGLGTSSTAPFNFDMSSLSPWPPASTTNANDGPSIEELLQGYMNPSSAFSFLPVQSSMSPLSHHSNPTPNPIHPASSGSSPSSCSTDPIFTPREAATPDSDVCGRDAIQCPKSKSELAKRIEEAGDSPFASPTGVKKCQDELLGTMISCSGSITFPKTQKSDQNVELLSAWRSITQNPSFKDTDISDLCAEFTAKARCDGQKVVLEPQGVVSILENLQKKH